MRPAAGLKPAIRVIYLMRIRIIDLDGSVAAQAPLKALTDEGLAGLIDLRDEAKVLRILARGNTMRRFGETVAAQSLPGRGAEITFYGSGDFHHLSAALVARHAGPLTIVHIDNHPDWVLFPPTFNCGAWINRALELPQVEKIITIGPCSKDMVWPQFKTGNLAAIASGKLELLPWRAKPSRVLWHKGAENGLLCWRNLADEPFDGFLDELPGKIPSRNVYISLDKDALTPDEAITNWDQGGMTLGHIEVLVTVLAQKFHISGIDVCGDYSPPRFADPLRATLGWLDHPALPTFPAQALAVNARTNNALLNLFRRVL